MKYILVEKQNWFYSLFRRSTNWTNSGPKWHSECEFCNVGSRDWTIEWIVPN